MYRRNLRVLVVAYWSSVWARLMTHENGNHSRAKHWTMFLCLLIYSHLKCKFWVHQDTEALGVWTVYWCISIKKKTNQIRSRDQGVHFSPACLSLYCHGKLLLRNSVTLIKIGTLDHFVWRRKWYCPLFQSAASSILRSHHACNCLFCDREGLVTRYGSEHIYLWAFSGMLCCWIRSFQAS